jgi:hypothetical protein
MQNNSTKQAYVTPGFAKRGQIAPTTLGIANLAGEPVAGLHLHGEL